MIEPYYQDELVTLYNAKAEDVLPELSTTHVVLTDPPYGIEDEYNEYSDSKSNLLETINAVIPTLLKNPLVAITCGNSNQHYYPNPSWTLAFATKAGTGRCSWGFSCWQPILVYGKDPYLANGLGARADFFLHTETAEKNGHPCPKPIGLWRKILTRISVDPNDVILDPFCGSGTTLVAAKMLKRKAIGIEMNEKYCELAVKQRLNKPIPLFDEQPPIKLDFGG